MQTYTFYKNGAELGTSVSLNISNLRRRRVSFDVDTFTFDCAQAADSTPLFAWGDVVKVKMGSTVIFVGRCETTPALGSGTQERISYVISGPFKRLEEIMYRQRWRTYNSGESESSLNLKSRVILCQSEGGAAITTGAQMSAIVAYAAGLYTSDVPFAAGTFGPDLTPPFDEQLGISCADAIRLLVRWTADAMGYVDYAADPPTINVVKRSAAAIAYLSFSGKVKVELTPRYDLQMPGVVVQFERTNTVDGVSYESYTTQTAGSATDPRCLQLTMELAGSTINNLTQKIKTEAFPVAGGYTAFFQARVPALADAQISVTAVGSFTRSGTKSLPRILTEGTITDWMIDDPLDPDVDQESETISARLWYTVTDANGNTTKHVAQPFSVNVICTDATTKPYSKIESVDAGEADPAGLADAIFASVSQLQYDGQVTMVEEDCSGAIYPGCALNITGGRAEWASMLAQVQVVDEYYDAGLTTITVGPAKQLDPDAVLAILRRCRNRKPAAGATARTTGKTEDKGGVVALGGPSAKSEGAGAGSSYEKLVIPDSSNNRIELDPSTLGADDLYLKTSTVGGKKVAKFGAFVARYHT